ncbi:MULTISPECIES: hypothetical protein [unclassified Candidatus Cardinium]|uniref:hypothetical protein n=1 Tax=unclassified Candidatus Cardinium TaxID=2641185 RepID=UPI001FB4EFCA|nr:MULTISPECIES: hypothetical protein [unclassified Candidatus Cardinium]
MSIRHLVLFFLISLILLIPSKAAPVSNLKKLKKGIYNEDLAVHRMRFCKPPKWVKKNPSGPLLCPLGQTKLLAARLAARKAAYERTNCLKGYTIQLYMGSSRSAALHIQDIASNFAYPATLHYRQPHYTVQLGFFFDRLEAYFVYLTLLRKIPGAMIRPSMRTRQS